VGAPWVASTFGGEKDSPMELEVPVSRLRNLGEFGG